MTGAGANCSAAGGLKRRRAGEDDSDESWQGTTAKRPMSKSVSEQVAVEAGSLPADLNDLEDGEIDEAEETGNHGR